MPQIESLHECFCKVTDPRARNSIFHIGAMLSIVAMAILSGHRNIQQIVRFANRIRMEHRKALGLPAFAKDSSYRKVPSYSAFYNLFKQLDIDAFSQCLSQWLAARSGTLPAALALDGKFIRDTVITADAMHCQRQTARDISLLAVDPQTVGFPHVETIIKVRRRSSATKKTEISHYVSSIPLDTDSPKQWMALIRGHWGGVEIRNHCR